MFSKLGKFLFIVTLLAIVGLILACLFKSCLFTPIEPIPKEEQEITLLIETGTTDTTMTTNLTTFTTTTMDSTTCVTTTSETVVETTKKENSVKETEQTKTQIDTTVCVTTISTTVETIVETTTEIPEVHDEFVKTFTHNTYYSSSYGANTCGGSGRKLISCNTTDEIKGSIASRYLYENYGYNYNGKRTKVYLVVYNHPEMTGYYYLDDCCADPINTIDFFYADTTNCPFQYDGLAGDVDCYICNY